MRYGLLALAVAALGIALYQGWLTRVYDHATTAALTEDARLAIDVRCRGREDRAARECRTMLKKVFLSGSLEPDKVLRAYCESVKDAPWGGSPPAPPELCVRRYGGWPKG
jgi:hypothetical protein